MQITINNAESALKEILRQNQSKIRLGNYWPATITENLHLFISAFHMLSSKIPGDDELAKDTLKRITTLGNLEILNLQELSLSITNWRALKITKTYGKTRCSYTLSYETNDKTVIEYFDSRYSTKNTDTLTYCQLTSYKQAKNPSILSKLLVSDGAPATTMMKTTTAATTTTTYPYDDQLLSLTRLKQDKLYQYLCNVIQHGLVETTNDDDEEDSIYFIKMNQIIHNTKLYLYNQSEYWQQLKNHFTQRNSIQPLIKDAICSTIDNRISGRTDNHPLMETLFSFNPNRASQLPMMMGSLFPAHNQSHQHLHTQVASHKDSVGENHTENLALASATMTDIFDEYQTHVRNHNYYPATLKESLYLRFTAIYMLGSTKTQDVEYAKETLVKISLSGNRDLAQYKRFAAQTAFWYALDVTETDNKTYCKYTLEYGTPNTGNGNVERSTYYDEYQINNISGKTCYQLSKHVEVFREVNTLEELFHKTVNNHFSDSNSTYSQMQNQFNFLESLIKPYSSSMQNDSHQTTTTTQSSYKSPSIMEITDQTSAEAAITVVRNQIEDVFAGFIPNEDRANILEKLDRYQACIMENQHDESKRIYEDIKKALDWLGLEAAAILAPLNIEPVVRLNGLMR